MGAQPDQSTGILLELMHENAAAQTFSVVDGPALGVVVLTIARMPEALQRALQSPTDYARLIACLRSMVATVRRIYNVLCIQVYIEIHKDVYTVNIKKYSCSHIYIYIHIYTYVYIYTCIHVYVEMYNYVQMSMCIHIKCAFIYDSFFQLYMFCHILRSAKSAVGTGPSADR